MIEVDPYTFVFIGVIRGLFFSGMLQSCYIPERPLEYEL
jgi:hypothetical protein